LTNRNLRQKWCFDTANFAAYGKVFPTLRKCPAIRLTRDGRISSNEDDGEIKDENPQLQGLAGT